MILYYQKIKGILISLKIYYKKGRELKREEIIALLDECEEIVVKIGKDEDYATGGVV